MSEKSKTYEKSAPRVYIRTFGCQMNVRDSEVIAGLLTTDDYRLTTDPETADVVIFNTCSVRQHAEDKVWSEIGRVAKLSPPDFAGTAGKIKAGGTTSPTKKIVGLVGCMAQNYKGAAFKRAPAIDFVVGPKDVGKVPEIVRKILNVPQTTHKSTVHGPRSTYRIRETDGKARPEEIYHTGFREDSEHAYVVISEGCENFCSYCVVPFVRGALRNRDYKEIIKEIKEAVGKGITRVTLLGQNVNAYESRLKFKVEGLKLNEKDVVHFVDLLRMVNEVKGLKEFGFVTSHPKDTSIELFKAIAELDKLKKGLHLPVQSGSDRVLKLMNRGYASGQYKKLVKEYRHIVPDGKLSTDVVVGFPTEDEKDFEDTYELMKEIKFDTAYLFKYSPRPGTDAEKLADDVPKKEKERRHRVLLDFQRELWRKKNADIRGSKR